MRRTEPKDTGIIDHIGMTIIGLYALGSSLFSSDFSETHLTFGFLPVPIFIGEILIVLCLGLLGLKYVRRPIKWQPWQICLAIYLGAVVIRALWDYYHGGGVYALRNSALFYYPVFILFAYVFYRQDYFRLARNIVAAALLWYLCSIFSNTNYYWYSCVVLFAVLVRRLPRPWLWGMAAVFVLSCNYRLLFAGSRTNLIGSLAAILYLIYVYARHFLHVPMQKKIAAVGVLLAALLLYVFFSGDKNGIRSLYKIKEIVNNYAENKGLIEQRRARYVSKNIAAKAYVDNQLERELVRSRAQLAAYVKEQQSARIGDDGAKGTAQHGQSFPVEVADYKNKLLDSLVDKVTQAHPDREFDTVRNNMVFRIFIWEDMFKELAQERAWLGFGFSKVQRSRLLEILGWGETEWGRDGWITAHNSFFHIIYRSGLIGLGLIVILAFFLVRMTSFFIAKKSFDGILLISILIYWFSASNTLVILELPHYAIVIWSILGMALAYAHQLRRPKP